MINLTLTPLHYIYLTFIIVIIIAMVKKKDITLICILGIFVLGLSGTGSIYQSAMGVAISMNLFGHGIALSSDYIIQAAPKLTADGAGIPIASVISASIPLVITMGLVTTVAAFYFLRKDIKAGAMLGEYKMDETATNSSGTMLIASKALRRALALLILALFASNIYIMYTSKLQGGDATALIGGTSVFILSNVRF